MATCFRAARDIGVLVILSTMLGCGSQPPTTEVQGLVQYGGKQLERGSVVFFAENGREFVAQLSSDGSYRITGLPRGELRVAVHGRLPTGSATQGEPSPAPRRTVDPKLQSRSPPWVLIPQRFGDPGSSGLRVTLVESTHTFDIVLDPPTTGRE